MGELFVQESAILSDKGKGESSSSEVRKKETMKESNKKAESANGKVTYSHDEAVQASISYFRGDELAARVWANKSKLILNFLLIGKNLLRKGQ